MEEKTIYDLKLHERLVVNRTGYSADEYMRAPGGWIYHSWGGGHIFVPYNEEFVRGNTRKSCRTCKFYDRNENTLTNPCRKCNKGFSERESKE